MTQEYPDLERRRQEVEVTRLEADVRTKVAEAIQKEAEAKLTALDAQRQQDELLVERGEASSKVLQVVRERRRLAELRAYDARYVTDEQFARMERARKA